MSADPLSALLAARNHIFERRASCEGCSDSKSLSPPTLYLPHISANFIIYIKYDEDSEIPLKSRCKIKKMQSNVNFFWEGKLVFYKYMNEIAILYLAR